MATTCEKWPVIAGALVPPRVRLSFPLFLLGPDRESRKLAVPLWTSVGEATSALAAHVPDA